MDLTLMPNVDGKRKGGGRGQPESHDAVKKNSYWTKKDALKRVGADN